MSVNQVNGFNQNFRGERKERSNGTSPLIPALLVGGATTAGLKYIGPKQNMTLDQFIKADKSKLDLTDEEKALVNKMPADEIKAPEAAAEGKAAETTTTAAATSETATSDELEKLNTKHADNIHEYKKAKITADSDAKLTEKIDDIYNKVVSYEGEEKKPLGPKENKGMLLTKKQGLEDEVKKHKADLKNDPLLNDAGKKALKETIAKKEAIIEDIDSKTMDPEGFKQKYSKKLADQIDEDLKAIEENISLKSTAVTNANDELTKATKAHEKAKEDHTKAKDAGKPEAELKELKAKEVAAEKEVAKKTKALAEANHAKTTAEAEKTFFTNVKGALDSKKLPKSEDRIANIREMFKQQIEKATVDGKGGTSISTKVTAENNAKVSFKDLKEANADLPKAAALNAEFQASLGEEVKATSTTATKVEAGVKESGEALKKEISAEGKAAFETLSKAGKLKTNMSWGKAGLWGGAVALGTLIIAAVAGGKKDEA